MKNREKYKDILMDYALAGANPALTKDGIKLCEDTPCDECFWDNSKCNCGKLRLAWLDKEYVQPETDWSKVPVDTRIYVGHTLEEVEAEAFPRYFAREFADGKVYAYAEGCSSWTAEGPEDVTAWEFAKLAEE